MPSKEEPFMEESLEPSSTPTIALTLFYEASQRPSRPAPRPAPTVDKENDDASRATMPQRRAAAGSTDGE
ncbi:uncharacterized protein DNG_06342 [Cephalotrichum gorgonifer]|uniref:Uncharacterized protein n=1 Tax=Cephalotrichum gorgonifer TaxID=2041049 RepID=A0AAE8SWI1_9PEZI|nr:uncharacterized protein DNG_06342 [Cephalotrichum gorgonifer]